MTGALVRSTAIRFWHYAGTTGLTLKAVVLNGPAGAFNFTTGAFITSTATATWSELQRDLTEIVDTGPNPMGIYSSTTSFPAALVPGDYTIVIQDGTTAVDDRLAIQPMHWDGTYWTPHSGKPVFDTRDLDKVPASDTWRMVQRSNGVVSLKPITIYQGETKPVAFDCANILAESIASMGTPTASVANLTPSIRGFDYDHAKLDLACGSAVTAGSYEVSLTVNTANGGPILLQGAVTVLDD